MLLYILDGIYPKECNTDRVSWYTAQQNCKEKGMQLTSYLPDTKCLRKRDLFWVGNHADENIQWGENSKCLPMCHSPVKTNA